MPASKNKIDAPFNLGSTVGQNVASNFEGIFSVKPMAKYLSGARCVLRVNNRIVGFAFAVSWRISTSATAIKTIDNYEDHELVPNRVDVSGSISGFRIPGSGPGDLLMQADVLSFLHQRYIEIEVRDSQTDNLLFYTSKALVTNRTENVRSGSLAEITLDFTAIGYRDERDPKLPKNETKENLDTKSNAGSFENLANKARNLFG